MMQFYLFIIMGNEINRDSAVYFDSVARHVPARLARGISRVAEP